MTKPHETICTSRAPKTRLIGTLEEYRAILAEKKIDLKHKKEIEKLFCECKENGNCCEGILKLPHTSRQIYNMILLEKMLQTYPESQEDCHTKAHMCSQNEPLRPKSRKFDENYIHNLAKPRKTDLKGTLEEFRGFMPPEKQKRIECQLGKTAISPETLEETMRKSQEVKVKNRRDDAVKLLRQIERKISGDILDEITCNIKRKLPKLIICREEPSMVSENVQKLQQSAFNIIVATNGPPQDRDSLDQFKSFAGVISDFIVKTMEDSVNPKKAKRFRCVHPLASVDKNRDLVEIAQKLMQKI